ncbi:Ca-activated chloride channel family protein [Cognatiyoonia koreensis]|uniref:Ca-activated chloride channel family protein n=1 Tax=Cognatiyoonia koreensis TaxID=364200 RepID=A0A1I0QT68_9RHOB|nr:VWA domain-containing protein [Cognatiyoonia koreensis]SEW30770.1 Ca-activated chloride channel family protein [Cognatiyoonia koreensis]
MSDDLDDLKSAMNAATPAPDASRRAANLALAQKNFEALQGTPEAARPNPVAAPSGLWTGLKDMLNSLTTRGALTATTALVACGFLFLTETGQDMWRESDFDLADVGAQAPKDAGSAPQIAKPAQVEEEVAVDGIMAPLPEALDEAQIELAPADEDAVVLAEPEIAQGESFAGSAELGQNDVVVEDGLSRIQPEAIEPAAPTATSRPRALAPQSSVAPTAIPPAPEASQQRLESRSSGVQRLVLDAEEEGPARAIPNTETFANEAPASLKITQEDPVSTFSIDVDTASYAVLRSSITAGQLPPAEAIRIEELINYFPYDYPAPDATEAPFRPTVSVLDTPWNADTQLVHVAIQGQMPAVEDRPPLNLVFLIDTSGSMNDPAKLPLLKQSFRLMLSQLRPEDEVAIVEYAGSAGQVLAPTPASDQATIIDAINGLGAGGSTNGQGGLQQAYAVADRMAADGEVSRILLATDGDFNVGINDPDALKDFIADKRDTGTYLSVLGFGRGNLDDATMQALAQNGNGTAAYIDTLTEAQKVLVDQLTGELFPIAGDVKIQVEWNPAEIAEYRLIGYETRALAREDFNNDKVDAGELGAGHTVTALYEVTPVGSPAQLSDPLRYAPATVAAGNGELGFLKLRYKDPGADESQLLTTPIVAGGGAPADALFAVAIAGWGQLLRDDRFLGEWGYDDAIALANANRGEDPFGYRTEAVQLMRLAENLPRNPFENGTRISR